MNEKKPIAAVQDPHDAMFEFTISQYVLASKKLHELCQPLFDTTDINQTAYLYATPDRKIIPFTSNTEFLIAILKQRLYIPMWSHLKYEDIQSGYYDAQSYHVNEDNKEQAEQLHKQFSCYDTFAIIKRYSNHTDHYTASFPTKSSDNINFCLNNAERLDKFFQNITPEIYKIKQSLVALPLEYREVSSIDVAGGFAKAHAGNFLGQVNRFSDPEVELNEKEKQILYHCLLGESAKEIAKNVHLSFRTVESHLSRIKKKYSCRTITELMAIFINQ